MFSSVTFLTEVSSVSGARFFLRLVADTQLLLARFPDFGHPKFGHDFLLCPTLIKHLPENGGLALCAADATCRLVWWSWFCPFPA